MTTRLKTAIILLAFLMPLMAAWAEEKLPDAKIVTYKSNVVKCLAPVHITQIDGKQKQLPQTGFDIEPGWHTLHGRYTVNLSNCPVAEERSRKPIHVPPLEWLFESGKIYHIGLDHSSPMRKNWGFVVWKVEYVDENGERHDISED